MSPAKGDLDVVVGRKCGDEFGRSVGLVVALRGAECLTKQLTTGRSGTQARQRFRLPVSAAPLGHEERTAPAFSVVGRSLDGVKLSVCGASRDELLVTAYLDHLGAREHDDEVGHADGRKAM